MIASLKIEILSKEINIDKGSLFQGVIMEQIDTEYAEKLHNEGIRPYTQTIIREDNKLIWKITSLNDEAYEKIILKLMMPSFNSFYLRHNQMEVKLGRRAHEAMTYQQFADHFYEAGDCRGAKVIFASPTSFKKDGKYFNIPDTRLIYQSAINKFNVFSGDRFDSVREIVNGLVDITNISDYDLHSCIFRLEGATVAAFEGKISYTFQQNGKLSSLANMLLHYGEYAGIGVKTAIGMGAIRLV